MNFRSFAWCVAAAVALGLEQPYAASGIVATYVKLPSLRGPSEALAVDQSGTFVAGYSYDQRGLVHATRWSFANGAWTMTYMPVPPNTGAICDFARGVNDAGDLTGNTTPDTTSRPVLWPFDGGSILLDCGAESGSARPYAISAGGQIAAGIFRQDGGSTTASVWRPGTCRQPLPPLVPGTSSNAYAINGDGTIVGGLGASPQSSGSVPVRWRNQSGQWQVEQLDSRAGLALGANSVGDLAGYVTVSCGVSGGCSRAMIWRVDGTSRELATLGGTDSWLRGINASGEVVGLSTTSNGTNTAFFWSESTGMVQLPIKGQWAGANAVSDIRADGTRLVVGIDANGNAIAWTVRIQ